MKTKLFAPGSIFHLKDLYTKGDSTPNHHYYIMLGGGSIAGLKGQAQMMSITSSSNIDLEFDVPIVYKNMIEYISPYNICSYPFDAEYTSMENYAGAITNSQMRVDQFCEFLLNLHYVITMFNAHGAGSLIRDLHAEIKDTKCWRDTLKTGEPMSLQERKKFVRQSCRFDDIDIEDSPRVQSLMEYLKYMNAPEQSKVIILKYFDYISKFYYTFSNLQSYRDLKIAETTKEKEDTIQDTPDREVEEPEVSPFTTEDDPSASVEENNDVDRTAQHSTIVLPEPSISTKAPSLNEYKDLGSKLKKWFMNHEPLTASETALLRKLFAETNVKTLAKKFRCSQVYFYTWLKSNMDKNELIIALSNPTHNLTINQIRELFKFTDCEIEDALKEYVGRKDANERASVSTMIDKINSARLSRHKHVDKEKTQLSKRGLTIEWAEFLSKEGIRVTQIGAMTTKDMIKVYTVICKHTYKELAHIFGWSESYARYKIPFIINYIEEAANLIPG